MHEKLIRGLKKNGLVRVEAPLVGHPKCAAVLLLLCEEGDDFEINSEKDNQLNYAIKLFNS